MAIIDRLDRRTRMALRVVSLLAMASFLTAPACASDHAGGHGAAAEGHGAAAPTPHDPTLPRTVDLGVFDLRNFRPTHNEIANIRFSAHVVLPAGTTDETIAAFESWKRRLRDQAITAMRSAGPTDLADPKLQRIQRQMLLRIKRLPTPEPIIDVYLTDFAVSSG